MEEKKIKWVRPLSFIRGPFKLFYTAIYEAREGDEFWRLISFRIEGNKPIKNYPLNQKIELIQRFGRQAAKAAHEEAEKLMMVSTQPEKVESSR